MVIRSHEDNFEGVAAGKVMGIVLVVPDGVTVWDRSAISTHTRQTPVPLGNDMESG